MIFISNSSYQLAKILPVLGFTKMVSLFPLLTAILSRYDSDFSSSQRKNLRFLRRAIKQFITKCSDISIFLLNFTPLLDDKMGLKNGFLIGLSCLVLMLSSCKIKQGYEALEVYNYFKAKQKFEKSLKKNPSPAAFGLSKIYFRKDNPFHNIDSAYHYSIMAVEHYRYIKPKKTIKLAEDFEITLDSLRAYRESISQYFYELARKEHTIMAYATFKAKHPWSPQVDSALYYREGLAFEIADEIGTSHSYTIFLNKYPDTRFTMQAQELLENSQFKETITENDLPSYKRFIEIFPANRNIGKAHSYIYQTLTNDNHPKSYRDFIQSYPENPHIKEAWRKYYRLSIADYRAETIEAFKINHPSFPFPEMIENDLKLVGTKLFPIRTNNQFGYMDIHGKIVISPKYEYAGFFSSGLAFVVINDKFGFIDKNNNIVIESQYDEVQEFENGRAVVEINDYMGWINTTGAYVLPPEYDDIGFFSEGIIYAYKNGRYQYFNTNGKALFNKTFDEAYSFSNGFAKVFYNDTVAFIKKDGTPIIEKEAKDLRYFSEGLYVIDFGDSLNIINLVDSLILPYSLERIGSLVDDRAIYEYDDEFGYLDAKGNIAIPAKYDLYPNYFQFSQFINQHAKIAKGNKYSLIDTLDKKILPAIFDNIGDYGELIPISKGSGWGYTDKSTRLIIRYIYDYAYPFIKGRAIVTKEGLSGVIDLQNEEIIPIKYNLIQRFESGEEGDTPLFFVHDNSRKFGIFDNNGEQMTQIQYVRFNNVNSTLLQLETQEGFDYFDIPNRKLITLSSHDE